MTWEELERDVESTLALAEQARCLHEAAHTVIRLVVEACCAEVGAGARKYTAMSADARKSKVERRDAQTSAITLCHAIDHLKSTFLPQEKPDA